MRKLILAAPMVLAALSVTPLHAQSVDPAAPGPLPAPQAQAQAPQAPAPQVQQPQQAPVQQAPVQAQYPIQQYPVQQGPQLPPQAVAASPYQGMAPTTYVTPNQGYAPQAQGIYAGQQPYQGVPPNPAQPPLSPEQLAFQQALQGIIPMTPEMVRSFRGTVDRTQVEIATPIGKAPAPVSRSVELSLKPGEAPPRLRLYPGNATTITFSDVTGAPWYVMSVTVGNPTAYQAVEAGEKGKTNMVVISPLTNHQLANNLVVTLKDNPVPIIFGLDTGVGEVDYRVDVGLQTRGPNATYDIVSANTLPGTNDMAVQSFLDGTPPKEARKVGTSSRAVEAWRYNDMIYVRSSLEVLSPAYIGRARNVSGTKVYTMVDTPVILVSQDGRMASVNIER